uniref:NADH-ubiquinone oxidoreductase chain 4 n=1 Tax=Saron marmoratus TaxID=1055079 RepID=A0A7G7WQH0_9EUCA|nr:NADH dehydrogenase subunit 4 [Saron marmoratus]QNH68797.1 NADH dehydrogenase subunit 4 [Saron marmoratus]
MMKFVISMLMLVCLSGSWIMVQCYLFIMSFFMLFNCLNNFSIGSLGFGLGLDSVSYLLVFLSFWIIVLALMASQKVCDDGNYISLFVVVNVFLLFSLIMTFSCLDYLFFYVSFESSLIPTLILIMGWGYQPERIRAGIYMLFYTLFASLPLLVCLLSLYNISGSLIMGLSYNVGLSLSFVDLVWYFCMMFAFMVKLPVYGVHLWLPKAHLEAPVGGSMILAGVLLKLGGYGMIRVLPMMSKCNFFLNWVWISFGLIGGIVVSFMCLRQIDMKSLIAYSSVAHMGLVLCGLVLMSKWGLSGGVVVMVGHGLCSSGLFCLANMVYERLGSRSLMIGKGLLTLMPVMSIWWFLFSIGNMAAPPTLNLVGEVSLIISLVSWSSSVLVGLGLLSFFSASYTLYLYSVSQFGLNHYPVYSCCSGKLREYLILLLHWLPLNFMILKGGVLVYM